MGLTEVGRGTGAAGGTAVWVGVSVVEAPTTPVHRAVVWCTARLPIYTPATTPASPVATALDSGLDTARGQARPALYQVSVSET